MNVRSRDSKKLQLVERRIAQSPVDETVEYFIQTQVRDRSDK